MARRARILVVADDSQVGRWLQHRLETLGEDHHVELDDGAAFTHRIATSGAGLFHVLFLALDFNAGGGRDAALELLDHMLGMPGLPPLAVVAENGDETTALACVRRGVSDYLPRRAIEADTLRATIAAAREQRRTRRRPHRTGEAAALPLKVPRDLIPRYTLLDVIGESPRATVYVAHSMALNRQVALKVSNQGEEGPLFAREFGAVAGLRHPAVIDIHDYGMHDGREFIAMEYFPCGDLRARLQNPLTEQECLDYLRNIARALAVVHASGILHRDLKPANIMLRDDGQAVLIDFGIARNLDERTHETRAGVLRGSPYYMSPEQAQGQELDPRSDLYSLGIILHEMLTGSRPYLGATAVEVLQQHVTAELPQLPPELAHHQPLLDGLLAKNRDDRFESAQSLLEALGDTDGAAAALAEEHVRHGETLPSLAQMQQSLVITMAVLRTAPEAMRRFLDAATDAVAGLRATLKQPARDQQALHGKLERLQRLAKQLARASQRYSFAPVADACHALLERIQQLHGQPQISGDAMLPLALLTDRVANQVSNIARIEEQRYVAPAPQAISNLR